MNEIVLTETEELVKTRRKGQNDTPMVTLSASMLYFNKAFADLFPGERVKISRSGPYIVFRPATGTSDSYAVCRKQGENGRGAAVGTPCLMQHINPSLQKNSYPVMPVKGGGWCIKIF